MSYALDKTIHFLKSRIKLIFGILPILVIIPCFFIIYKSPYHIIRPIGKDSLNKVVSFCYSDKEVRNGNSEIKIDKFDSSGVRYRYTLRKGPYPYLFAKINFTAEGDSAYFDFSDYDYIKVKIRSEKGSRIILSLLTHVENFTDIRDMMTYGHSQYILNVTNQLSEINVPIKDLYTPDWWYTEVNKKESNFGAYDYSKTGYVGFSNCINLKEDIEDVVDIEEISFRIDLTPFYVYTAAFSVIYYMLIGIIFWKKNNKSKKKVKINFINEKEAADPALGPEENTVFTLLTSTYFQKDLTIIDVQNATGLPEKKITQIIKGKTELNFKQFLNMLRITEAKRLLSETDLPVSEIAEKVGYSNAPYFNKVFKDLENCSPNDFRKENRKVY